MSVEEVHHGEDLSWVHVDEATGASQQLRGRNLPRMGRRSYGADGDHGVIAYSRRGSAHLSSTIEGEEQDSDEDEDLVADDLEVDDDYGEAPPIPHESGPSDEDHHDSLELDEDI